MYILVGVVYVMTPLRIIFRPIQWLDGVEIYFLAQSNIMHYIYLWKP